MTAIRRCGRRRSGDAIDDVPKQAASALSWRLRLTTLRLSLARIRCNHDRDEHRKNAHHFLRRDPARLRNIILYSRLASAEDAVQNSLAACACSAEHSAKCAAEAAEAACISRFSGTGDHLTESSEPRWLGAGFRGGAGRVGYLCPHRASEERDGGIALLPRFRGVFADLGADIVDGIGRDLRPNEVDDSRHVV